MNFNETTGGRSLGKLSVRELHGLTLRTGPQSMVNSLRNIPLQLGLQLVQTFSQGIFKQVVAFMVADGLQRTIAMTG